MLEMVIKWQKWLVKWGLIKWCGSVSATPALRKTRNPYFLTIYPLCTKLSDNLMFPPFPWKAWMFQKNPINTHLDRLFLLRQQSIIIIPFYYVFEKNLTGNMGKKVFYEKGNRGIKVVVFHHITLLYYYYIIIILYHHIIILHYIIIILLFHPFIIISSHFLYIYIIP